MLLHKEQTVARLLNSLVMSWSEEATQHPSPALEDVVRRLQSRCRLIDKNTLRIGSATVRFVPWHGKHNAQDGFFLALSPNARPLLMDLGGRLYVFSRQGQRPRLDQLTASIVHVEVVREDRPQERIAYACLPGDYPPDYWRLVPDPHAEHVEMLGKVLKHLS